MAGISETIERFSDIKCADEYSKRPTHAIDMDLDDALALEKRYKEKKEAYLRYRRHEAIKDLNEKGFPILRPKCFTTEDHGKYCSPVRGSSDGKNRESRILMTKWPDKPQNSHPKDLLCLDPREIECQLLRVNEPVMLDRMVRAKYNESLRGTQFPSKPYILSDVFPQLQAQGQVDENEATLAKKYLYSTEYQTSYGGNFPTEDLCRKIYPLPLLQSLPNPLKHISGFSTHYPPTNTWQPESFNASCFDARLARYDHINEPRPYEFSTHAPRIDQIPSYSGEYATRDRRVEDDNPYKTYVPITKVRGTYPSNNSTNLQPNIVGYTGHVRSHVNTAKPTTS